MEVFHRNLVAVVQGSGGVCRIRIYGTEMWTDFNSYSLYTGNGNDFGHALHSTVLHIGKVRYDE